MNKLPVKQVYILLVAIFGLVAISIYSTYAIFTLESSTDNIVTIRTPENLYISSQLYEYKQVEIPKDSYITTDIDIYNNYNYELCYSIWYKALKENIKVYEKTVNSLSTNGTLAAITGKRVTLLIINDNNSSAKVNIGVAYAKNEGTCEFNISNEKSQITTTIDAKSLTDTLTKNAFSKNIEAGYLTYKDIKDDFTLSNEKTYYVATDFTYQDELFTLKEPKELELKDLSNYKNYYLCEDDNKCEKLYHLIEIENTITKYDILLGYLGGENGLRKISNDYYYYGDNPNNYIYYNCNNENDLKTCELWRIIGFKYDSTTNKYITKIISNDYLDNKTFDDDKNTWSNSTINKYLNDEYKLKQSMHEEYTFKEENIISLDSNLNDILLLDNENKAKVMLLNVSDYLYTSTCQKMKINEYDTSCLKNNWLNRGKTELTMTTKYELPTKNPETNEDIIPENNTIYAVGNEINEVNITNKLNVRPVIYLKERTLLLNGDGSFDNPYVIR